jgi:LPXTG-motif cell wall-anchored protein
LLQVAGLPVLKRIAAPAGALLAVLASLLIWRRRRRK